MISLHEAQQFVLASITALDPVEITISDARGCVVARPVVATELVPGFINSSMDGFALHSGDTVQGFATLRVIDAVLAGDVAAVEIHSGEATRIMTGAPLPPGADCVEMIEEVEAGPDSDTIRLHRPVAAGTFVRFPGDDVALGTELVRAGDELTAVRLGVLASQGLTTLWAHPRPRVGVLSTGNELSYGPGKLAPGQIRDVNRPMLLALVRDADCEPVDLGVVSDDYDATRRALLEGVATCDAVLTTGGVSMGDVDYVKIVINELGGDSARSLQVAVRPGKPFAFGVVGDRYVPVFGLPGNPVSTRVSFELLVRPALRARAGRRELARLTVDAVTDVDLPREADGKVHVVHAVASFRHDGRLHVESVMRQGSHLLHAVAGANAMVLVPDGGGLRTGDSVRTVLLTSSSSAQLGAVAPPS